MLIMCARLVDITGFSSWRWQQELKGATFDGVFNNVCRLETRFIGPVAEKDPIGTFIFFTQCEFVTANVDCVVNDVSSVFFEQCYFFYNNQAGLYCANLNI